MGLTENSIKFKFKWLEFVVRDDKIDIADGVNVCETQERCNFAEVNVAG